MMGWIRTDGYFDTFPHVVVFQFPIFPPQSCGFLLVRSESM